MRAVTELGFIASVSPERSAVQEAPQSGDSFFDTLRRANETAEEAEKVTDDKPETAVQDDDAAEVKTEEKTETEEKSEETEEVQEHDVAAEMMALGRMFTVAVEEGTVLENRAGSPLEAVQALSGDAQGGNAESETEFLTPVENGEEILLAETQAESVTVDAQSFADTMTQTLGEMQTQVQMPGAQETMPVTEAVPAQDAPIQSEVPEVQAEQLQQTEQPQQVEQVQQTEQMQQAEQVRQTEQPKGAEQVQQTGQPQQAERIQQTGQEQKTDMEPAAEAERTAPVEAQSAEEPLQAASPVKAEAEGVEKTESAEALDTENAPAEVTTEAVGESEEASREFSGQGNKSGGEDARETLDVQLPEAEIPMMDTLRGRFSPDNAIQQIDNTELAQAIERAIDRFAEDFRLAEVDMQQITIKLDPEELGSLSITVAAENNVLTAKIVTDNKEAASLLSAQIEQFLEAMEQKGIKVEKAEVVYNSQLDLGEQAAGENQGGRRDESRTVQGISAIEMVEAEEAGRADENTVPIAAVQDEATNYYVFDDKYVPSHVYKV